MPPEHPEARNKEFYKQRDAARYFGREKDAEQSNLRGAEQRTTSREIRK
jgi:hypothetical protein